MRVHLFDGISSSSWNKYILKWTSVDNEKEFGTDATEVDDMLKSSRGLDEAVDLIQWIRNIWKAGGFNLTKFVSNKIEAMESIPEENWRKKHQHQRSFKWRKTKGKSIRSSMKHQNRYIWIQDIRFSVWSTWFHSTIYFKRQRNHSEVVSRKHSMRWYCLRWGTKGMHKMEKMYQAC